MAKPYSLDLRERAVAAVTGGESRRAVAKLFQVSPSVVIRWVQQFAATGSAAARPMGGSRRDALGEQRGWLRQRLAEKPDLTLDALRLELMQRGLQVSLWTIWNFCRAEKLTFKKKPAAQRAIAPSDSPLATELAAPATQAPARTACLH